MIEIKDIFESYSSKMVQIHLYQRAMKDLATKELKELYKYEQSLEENPELKEFSYSSHNMAFRSAKEGTAVFFGSKKITTEERKLAVILHKNKQYQWLLAEAYEEFEDFLENIYAYAGFKNHNFWPLRDYGNISLEDLKLKPLTWFEEQAKKKKDIPSSIINKFRESFPKIADIEIKNGLEVNLRFVLVLIEFLRHVIVHKGGTVSDKEEFIKRVLQKAGVYNNGKPNEKYITDINAYFGDSEYKNTIVLIEVSVDSGSPVDTYVNVFDILSGYLMAYAHLICESLSNSHNKKINSDHK